MAPVRYLIFHVTSGSINDACLTEVERQVRAIPASTEHLHLVIQTHGGSPYAAVAIMNILQSKFAKISTLVPKYAKSAGTLMALGTDVIYMSVRSALGPLDLPIEHPTDGSRMSALDVKNSATELASLANLIALERYKTMRDEDGENDIGISKLEATKIAFSTADALISPIIGKIDPYHLNRSVRELRIGRDYAWDMLLSRMMKGQVRKALDTANNFVNMFPVHEYSIFSSDAKSMLGLTVGDLDALAEWNLIKDDVAKECAGKNHVILYGEKNFPAPVPSTIEVKPSEAKKEPQQQEAKKNPSSENPKPNAKQ